MDTIETIKPYKAQLDAANPKASVWVSASAGSGKTKVLVDRVLRLLLNGEHPAKILCLTFTRAAAAEMQNRIRRLLGEWAVMDEKGLGPHIATLTGKKASSSNINLARRLFAQVLDTPGGLKIQTIHAFCESVLGRFPLEAGLSPHFRVMDDRAAEEALAIASNEIFIRSHNGLDEQLTKAMTIVSRWSNEQDFIRMMTEIARNRGRIMRFLGSKNRIPSRMNTVYQHLGITEDTTVDNVIKAACSDKNIKVSSLRRAANLLLSGAKTDVVRGKKILLWVSSPNLRKDLFEEYSGCFVKKSDGKIFERLATKGVLQDAPAVLDVLRAEANRVFEVIEKCKAVWTAEATAAFLCVVDTLIEQYENYKKKNSLLDYDDLILKTRQLVEMDAGWVMFKLDEGIDHILIDEAQDSNLDQWAVVTAIADEFYAGEGARKNSRTVFAVGDNKQSIFSFQGAAPEAFSKMSLYFEQKTRDAGRKWERVPLDISFRSSKSILEAVDAVFADAQVRSGVSDGKVFHQAHRIGQAGLVEVWPPVKPIENLDRELCLPGEILRDQATPARRLAHAIAGLIEQWLSKKEILSSANRPIQPGDILVLVRRRTEFVDELIRELKDRNVDVAGLDRMLLTSQLAVRDLIAIAKFALLPEDDLNLAVILKGPLFGFAEEKLFEVCYQREGSVWEALRKRAKGDPLCALATSMLTEILQQRGKSPPFEFFARILGPMGGRARIIAHLREEANDPLDEFLGLALEFELSNTPSLQGFLKWIVDGEAEIKRDLDQGIRDEVRIMTVHGAKGLQAPIVFLSDTMQVPKVEGGILWKGETSNPQVLLWPPRADLRESCANKFIQEERTQQYEEYRRLLYVAMTRAEDRLYVTGYGTSRAAPEGAWYNLIWSGLENFVQHYEFSSHSGGSKDQESLAWTGEGLRLKNDQQSTADRADDRDNIEVDVTDLPNWVETHPPAEPARIKPLVPSKIGGIDRAINSPIGRDAGVSFRRGILVHRLLQTLPELEVVERLERGRTFLRRPVHGLAEHEVEDILLETIAILDHIECKKLFGPTSRAEVPITGVVGGTPVSGRIDRVVIETDKIQILDFKTNRSPPVLAKEVPPAYLKQMAIYRALLQKIWKNRRVDCFLLWTHGPDLMALEEKMLVRYTP